MSPMANGANYSTKVNEVTVLCTNRGLLPDDAL